MRIKLFTAKKEFVAEYEIPGFSSHPETVVWGYRVFVREEEYTGEGEKFEYVYMESVFNYCIVDYPPVVVRIK